MKVVHLKDIIIPVELKLSAKEERHIRVSAMIANQRIKDKKKAIEKFRLLKLQGKLFPPVQ